jgi:hypothetical protein
MVDSGIKKATISGENLPPIFVKNATDVGKYYVRFRVVSEDRSRRSAYSPTNIVSATDLTQVITVDNPVKYQYYSDTDSFRINWTVPSEIKQTRFDVYARWHSSDATLADWVFVGTVAGAQSTLNIEGAYVQVRVQVETNPHIINNPAKVLQTGSISTAQTNISVSAIDGGSIV